MATSKGGYSSENAERIRKDFSTKTTKEIFTREESASIDPLMSPVGIEFRESRDSENYPNSKAAIFALDLTSSMLELPVFIVKEKLPTIIEVSKKHGVHDLALLFLGVGDHECDSAPLQVGQFESDEVNLNKWLTSVWREGGGGGNEGESYQLAWYVAGKMTSIDCYEKRGEKGFLFTCGDEPCLMNLPASAQEKIFGKGQYSDITSKELLALAQEKYHVFHIHCKEGSAGRRTDVVPSWKKLIGQNLLILENKESIGELIASTMALFCGADLKDVTKDFDKKTALAVESALAHVDGGALAKKSNAGTGIAKF